MNLVADRNGNITREDSVQDRFLTWVYGHRVGRMLLRPLVSPLVSKAGGWLLNTKVSALLVKPFIYFTKMDMSDYEKIRYTSYNDFFTRRLAVGARHVEMTPECFISPCDSRLSVYEIDGNCQVDIKHTRYSAASLLRDKKLAAKYQGGCMWVFRLCVDDYHRYIYTDRGTVSPKRRIPGVFHTVNPVANDVYPIYKENTREYSLLLSEHFGTIVQMEVGALLVGKIENCDHTGIVVERGQEKGNFAFGGSTIILMTGRNKVLPDPDILKNSRQGIETRVHMGESVGTRYEGKMLV